MTGKKFSITTSVRTEQENRAVSLNVAALDGTTVILKPYFILMSEYVFCEIKNYLG